MISSNDVDRVLEIVNWLEKNVGPKVSAQGASIKGLGWNIWPRNDSRIPGKYMRYDIELTKDVDDETKTFFYLRWSQ